MRFTRTIAPQMSRAYYLLRRLTKESEQHRRRPGGGGQPALRCPECGRAVPHRSPSITP
jgi:hypothetical protein